MVWDLPGRRARIVDDAAGRFSALAFAADGSTLAAAHEHHVVGGEGFDGWKIERDVMLWSLGPSR
jgi:hypothetical protein